MIDPCFQQWLHYRWENKQTHRNYEARVLKNLLDVWEVFCLWGYRNATRRFNRHTCELS